MLIKANPQSEAKAQSEPINHQQSEAKANQQPTKRTTKMSMTSTPRSIMDSEFGYEREYVVDDVEDYVDDDDYIYNEDDEYYNKICEEEEEGEDYEDDTNDP